MLFKATLFAEMGIGGGVTELGVVKAETESDSSSSKIRGRLEVGGKISSSSDSSSVTHSVTTAGLSIGYNIIKIRPGVIHDPILVAEHIPENQIGTWFFFIFCHI